MKFLVSLKNLRPLSHRRTVREKPELDRGEMVKTDFIQGLLPQRKRPPCKTGSTLNSVWTSGVYSRAAGGSSWVESCKEETSGLAGFWLNQCDRMRAEGRPGRSDILPGSEDLVNEEPDWVWKAIGY